MKRFLSLKLSFDRAFSGKWRFQLLWLVSGSTVTDAEEYDKCIIGSMHLIA